MFGVVCVCPRMCERAMLMHMSCAAAHIYAELDVQVRVWITDLIEQGWMDRWVFRLVIDRAACIVFNM